MERENISWNGKKKFHWIVVTFGMFHCPFVARFFLLLWKFDNLYDFLYEKHDISWYNLWRLCDCAIRWVSIVNKVNKIFDEQNVLIMIYGDLTIIQLTYFLVYGMSQGIILPLSGYVAQFIGLKNAIIVGCIIFQIATYLTYYSLQHSLVTVSITYGFLSSLGANIALIPPMTIGK